MSTALPNPVEANYYNNQPAVVDYQNTTSSKPITVTRTTLPPITMPVGDLDYKEVRGDLERCKRIIEGLHSAITLLRANEKNLSMHVADQKAEIHALSLLSSALASTQNNQQDDLISQLHLDLASHRVTNRYNPQHIEYAKNAKRMSEEIDAALQQFVQDHPYAGVTIEKHAASGIYTINGERVRMTWDGTQPLVSVGHATTTFRAFVAPLVEKSMMPAQEAAESVPVVAAPAPSSATKVKAAAKKSSSTKAKVAAKKSTAATSAPAKASPKKSSVAAGSTGLTKIVSRKSVASASPAPAKKKLAVRK